MTSLGEDGVPRDSRGRRMRRCRACGKRHRFEDCSYLHENQYCYLTAILRADRAVMWSIEADSGYVLYGGAWKCFKAMVERGLIDRRAGSWYVTERGRIAWALFAAKRAIRMIKQQQAYDRMMGDRA